MSHSELTVCEISQMFFRDPSRKVRDDTDGCNFLILSYCSPVLGELSKGLRGCLYLHHCLFPLLLYMLHVLVHQLSARFDDCHNSRTYELVESIGREHLV